MRIGIDISQLAYPGTGVANYLKSLVEELMLQDSHNEYVLFFASLRGKLPPSKIWDERGIPRISQTSKVKRVIIKQFKIPPTVLDVLWNRLHVLPIETLVGPVDVFISSDWTQPPSKAKKVTILYDLVVYKHPEETAAKIVEVQKRKLKWVKREVDKIICISEATKRDAEEILGISKNRLEVVYPGI